MTVQKPSRRSTWPPAAENCTGAVAKRAPMTSPPLTAVFAARVPSLQLGCLCHELDTPVWTAILGEIRVI